MPEGYYSQETKNWPAILFLHGDGERGDGLDELAYTRIHGPLFEAWVMKKKTAICAHCTTITNVWQRYTRYYLF